MLMAKVAFKNGKEVIAEVVRQGRALFDPRPGWVLLKLNPQLPERKREVMWVHPDDDAFIWVREFNF